MEFSSDVFGEFIWHLILDGIPNLIGTRRCPPSFYLIRGFGSMLLWAGDLLMAPAEAAAGGVVLGIEGSIVSESGWFCLPGWGDIIV